MNDNNLYRQTFGQVTISEEVKSSIMNIPAGQEKQAFRGHRRFSMAMVCCLVLVLITGTAVAVSSGGNLKDWFADEWKLLNGEEMSAEQMNVIDSLTTPLDISKTAGDVTVTLDSVTYSDGYYWMLVKAEGIEFNDRHANKFDEMKLTVYGEDGREIGWNWGTGTHIDENGILIMLIDGEIDPDVVDDVEGQKGRFVLELAGLQEEKTKSDKVRVLQEGQWHFEFELPLEATGKVLTAEPADVQFLVNDDEDNLQTATCQISNLQVSAVDIKYTVRGIASEEVHRDMPRLVLENGYEVGIGGGLGEIQEDGSWKMQYQLQMPVDVDNVKSVKFGLGEIEVE